MRERWRRLINRWSRWRVKAQFCVRTQIESTVSLQEAGEWTMRERHILYPLWDGDYLGIRITSIAWPMPSSWAGIMLTSSAAWYFSGLSNQRANLNSPQTDWLAASLIDWIICVPNPVVFFRRAGKKLQSWIEKWSCRASVVLEIGDPDLVLPRCWLAGR